VVHSTTLGTTINVLPLPGAFFNATSTGNPAARRRPPKRCTPERHARWARRPTLHLAELLDVVKYVAELLREFRFFVRREREPARMRHVVDVESFEEDMEKVAEQRVAGSRVESSARACSLLHYPYSLLLI